MFARTLAAAAFFAGVAIAAPHAAADKAPVYTSAFSNVAVGGYDPVAYFTTGAPAKGDKAFAVTYQGAEYRFVSQANLDAFQADPAKYAPQYGGYCAWAISQGYTAKGDPQHWAIVDGKLYLNYNAKVKADWDKDRAGFIEKADANWPAVLED